MGLAMEKELGNGFILRNIRETDLESLLKHIQTVHGAEVGPLIPRLLKHYPNFSLDDNFVVIDSTNNKVVAYLCLVQRTYVFEDIEIPAGQMDIVGTKPEVRHRGFIRHLNEALEKRITDYNLNLLTIAGIPYFYRLFGYEFAIEMHDGIPITTEGIPKLKEGESEPVTIEFVSETTFPEFLACRDQRNSYLDFYYKISPEHFHFYTTGKLGDAIAMELYLVKKDDEYVGCFILDIEFGSLYVRDLWIKDNSHLLSILRFLKTVVKRVGKPLKVEPPSKDSLLPYLEQVAGGRFPKPYAWYARIPSIKRFIENLTPVIEKRLEKSEFKGLSDDVRISCYREGYVLSFSEGKLNGVETLSRKDLDKWDVRIPPLIIIHLLLGYRNLSELQEIYPDVRCQGHKKALLEVLFPKIKTSLTPTI